MNISASSESASPKHGYAAKTSQVALGAFALASILVATSGCVVAVRPAPAPVVYEEPAPTAPAEVVVNQDMPAPLVETVGFAPGPGFVWVGGYYHWAGARWVWHRGAWLRPPHAGAVWVGPRFYVRGGARVFVRGYWR